MAEPVNNAHPTPDCEATTQAIECLGRYSPGELLQATATLPAADPLWLSALRGRVMAAIASAASLATSGVLLYQSAQSLTRGVTPDNVSALAQNAAAVADAGLALVVAAASLIALLASLNSKAREWLRRSGPLA